MTQEQFETEFVNMKDHPISAIYPMMDSAELQELAQDIKANGLLEPITLYEGKILDGRNRYLACQQAQVQPRYEQFTGNSPAAFVISMNAKRRHLTPSQRAAAAVLAEPHFAEEAKKRQQKAGEHYGRGKKKVLPKLETPIHAADESAKAFGVSHSYVSQAKKLKQEDPEIFADVHAGKKTLQQAERERREQKREQRRKDNREKAQDCKDLLSIGATFATILIDPPWDVSDEGDVNQLGRAKADYFTMPYDDLLKLPVEKLADVDSHIYCWVTNRSMPKVFSLLDAWGFRYVTLLTWPKSSFGMGNYFRGQTEHIAFGVRGSQMLKRKDASTLLPCWSRGNKHSAKPTEIYKFIESCSPGPYLEIFGRMKRQGWTIWGADAP